MSDNPKPLRRNNRPPERTGPREEVHRVGPNECLTCCILSDNVEGFIVHWDDSAGRKGRSRECLEDAETCDGCQRKLPAKWLGYVDVLAGTRGRVFVEMTPECARLLLESIAKGESLRGIRGQFRRTAAKNGRLRWERLEFTENPIALPEARSPEHMLRALWAWHREYKRG